MPFYVPFDYVTVQEILIKNFNSSKRRPRAKSSVTCTCVFSKEVRALGICMALVQIGAFTLVCVSAHSNTIAIRSIWTGAAEPVKQTDITDTSSVLGARVIMLAVVNK